MGLWDLRETPEDHERYVYYDVSKELPVGVLCRRLCGVVGGLVRGSSIIGNSFDTPEYVSKVVWDVSFYGVWEGFSTARVIGIIFLTDWALGQPPSTLPSISTYQYL